MKIQLLRVLWIALALALPPLGPVEQHMTQVGVSVPNAFPPWRELERKMNVHYNVDEYIKNLRKRTHQRIKEYEKDRAGRKQKATEPSIKLALDEGVNQVSRKLRAVQLGVLGSVEEDEKSSGTDERTEPEGDPALLEMVKHITELSMYDKELYEQSKVDIKKHIDMLMEMKDEIMKPFEHLAVEMDKRVQEIEDNEHEDPHEYIYKGMRGIAKTCHKEAFNTRNVIFEHLNVVKKKFENEVDVGGDIKKDTILESISEPTGTELGIILNKAQRFLEDAREEFDNYEEHLIRLRNMKKAQQEKDQQERIRHQSIGP